MPTRVSVLRGNLIYISIIGFFSILSISATVYSQENWSQLFYDDFEDGNSNKWELTFNNDQAKWEIINETNNYVFSGFEWCSAMPNLTSPYPWSNYSFKCRIKIIEKHVHIHFRTSEKGRYYITFGVSMISLISSHDIPEHKVTVHTEYYENFDYNRWYDFEIHVQDSTIKIYVDDVLKIEIDDPEPLLYGNIGIETNPGSVAYFDDIMVTGDTLDYDPHPKEDPNPFISTLPGYTWLKTGGPNGGLGYDIRIHPIDKKIMFVTDNPSGVNKSIDQGATWKQKNTGIDIPSFNYGKGAPIFSLTIDPSNPSIVWSGTQNLKGIYKSSDCGETWNTKTNGIIEGDEIAFRGFAIHPQDSNIILASGDLPGENNELIKGALKKGFIYKTIDGGENWYKVWAGENLSRVLIYDYTNPDILYCSTGIFDAYPNNADPENLKQGGEGVLKSIDGGETWFNINNGLENLSVGFLEMHPTNPNILFAATGDGFFCQEPYNYRGAIYKTVNGGENWINVLQGGAAYFSVVTISKSNPDIIYAGHDGDFYKSENGGDSWILLSKPDYSPWGPPGIWGGVPISAAVDPDNPDVVFVNSYQGGNYKSVDGAKTWINSSKGYSGANLHDLIVDPNDPAVVYATAFSGPFYSTDGGDTWKGMLYGASIAAPLKIAINPHNSNELLIANGSSGSIFKSANKGMFWELVFVCPEVDQLSNDTHHFKAISYAPSDPAIIFAGIRCTENTSGFEPIAKPSFGMFKSTDGGKNWLEINNGLENTLKNVNCVAVSPINPNIVYIATGFDGIYKSENGGDSWVRKSNGLTSARIASLTIDRNNPNIIYAGSGDGKGVFKTMDGGELWIDFNNNIQLTCPSYLSPVGNSPEGISFEKAKSISQTYNLFGDIPWTRILDIEIDPSNSDNVYIVDDHSGIYVSNNAGDSWWLINEGLNVLNPTSLSISSDGEILYLGTGSGGVFRLIIGGNKEPRISSIAPSVSDTLYAQLGDSLLFEVMAFDFNQDTLNYSWFVNSIPEPEIYLSKYLLNLNSLNPTLIDIRVDVSDNDTTISINWVVEVVTYINEYISICDGGNYMGWKENGTYKRMLNSIDGADSIVITKLSIYPSYVPDIIVKGDTLVSKDTYASYQWYDEDGIITGASKSEYIITKSGVYYLVIVDEFGCTNTSGLVNAEITSIQRVTLENLKYTIIPNPNNGNFIFKINLISDDVITLRLINAIGQTVENREIKSPVVNQIEQFDISRLSKGIYYLVVSSNKYQKSEKIVVN